MYARLVLARAATVAIRYTAIRRQFGDKDAPIYVHGQVLETPTLDYTMARSHLMSFNCCRFNIDFSLSSPNHLLCISLDLK